MKKLIFHLGLITMLLGSQSSTAQYSNTDVENLGWHLAAQAWTFKNFTFTEALDKMKIAGINYVEMFPDQQIGGGIEGTTNYHMSPETREKLLALIKSKGMKLVNYGVITPDSPEEWGKLMEFAKAMGIETIVSEPDSMQLNFIEPLCEQYQIKVAIHNHPNPVVFHQKSMYWNPDFAMQQIANRNKYIGLCADLGHWIRSGLDPLESLKKYNGRVLDVHAKDLVPGGDYCGYHDVPWGTGISNFPGLIWELKRQGYKGTITVEYEYHWDNSLPEIIESVNYFRRLCYWIGKE